MPQTRRIITLAFPCCQILDVVGPLQIFAGANDEAGRAAYAPIVAAAEPGPFLTNGGLTLHAGVSFADLDRDPPGPNDTVIAVGGTPGTASALKQGVITGIIAAAHARGARIVSVCTGTFFLAAAGLLDGRRAATHWSAADRLRHFRPMIQVDADSIYVHDGGIWTSAGVTAGIDLALALVEADLGRAIALAVAREHVVFPIRPGGQAQFSASLAAQTATDPRLARLAERIAESPRDDWRTETLASTACVSPRSLSRLFRKELNVSPVEFVERVRIDAARRALLRSAAPIERIAEQCGFGSARRMDRAFARTIDTSPGAFRARFKTQGDAR